MSAAASSASNQKQDDENRIMVYLRIRPAKKGNPEKDEPPEINPSEGSNYLMDPQDDNKTVVLTDNNKPYTFDHVYDGSDVSQEEIYQKVTAPVIDNVFKGFWGTTMCYGQTGTGKSFTMCNITNPNDPTKKPIPPELEGVIPRAMRQIFDKVNGDQERTYTIKFSMIQIYRDRLQDLFNYNPDAKNNSENELKMGRDKDGVTFPGLVEHVVTSEEDFRERYHEGNKYRVVTATKMNPESSRGHAALFIQVQSEPKNDPSGEVRKGKLFLIDLAGYERLGKAGIHGPVMTDEARTINSSLLALGHCVQALSGGAPFVPWRNAKLTRMLEDAVGGKSKCSIVLTAGPSSEHAHETVGTLQFGQRAMSVATASQVVIERDWKKVAEMLKAKLAIAESKLNAFELEATRTQFDRIDSEDRMSQELEKIKARQREHLEKLRASGATQEAIEHAKQANETEVEVVVEQQGGELDMMSQVIRRDEVSRKIAAEEKQKLERELEALKQENANLEKRCTTAETESRRLSSQLHQVKVYCASVGVDISSSDDEKAKNTSAAAPPINFNDPQVKKMMEDRLAQVKEMLKEQHSADMAERVEPLQRDLDHFKKLYQDLRVSLDDQLQVQKDTLTNVYEREIQELRDSSIEAQEKLKNTHKIIKKTYQRQSEELTAEVARLTEQLRAQILGGGKVAHQKKHSSMNDDSTSASSSSNPLLSNSNFNSPMPPLLTGYMSFLINNFGDGLGRKYQLTSDACSSFFARLQTILIPFGNLPMREDEEKEGSGMNFKDGCYLNFDKSRLKWGMHGSSALKDAIKENSSFNVRGIIKLEGNRLFIALTARSSSSSTTSTPIVKKLLDIIHQHIVELCGGVSQTFVEAELHNRSGEKLADGIKSYIESMGGDASIIQEQIAHVSNMNDSTGKEIDIALKALPTHLFSEENK